MTVQVDTRVPCAVNGVVAGNLRQKPEGVTAVSIRVKGVLQIGKLPPRVALNTLQGRLGHCGGAAVGAAAGVVREAACAAVVTGQAAAARPLTLAAHRLEAVPMRRDGDDGLRLHESIIHLMDIKSVLTGRCFRTDLNRDRVGAAAIVRLGDGKLVV